ncbi:MAG: PQQ-binding-like beta-propeller repeat protein [Prevotellaceae bacterium]|nr:PQQ-binding-like beta-propeller repeat protein [Prevotellaceae bacterium]
MIITNYFQVRAKTPLRVEVLETLKILNETNSNNTQLQEQIRELDLMSRKAYFIHTERLALGVYIIAGMLLILIVSLRLLYSKDKNIPARELTHVDEWVIKTGARKYISWSAGALAAVTLLFVFLSSSHLISGKTKNEKKSEQLAESTGEQNQPSENNEEFLSENVEKENIAETQNDAEKENPSEEKIEEKPVDETDAKTAENEQITNKTTAETQPETKPQPETAMSKVTHNGFRGNNSNGISQAKQIPVKWDLNSGNNIAWKTTIPKHGYNSPVINGNKVFLSGADEHSRELYCYELASGKLLWTLAADNIAGSPSAMPKTSDDTGLAASSVVTNGKQVCAIFATGDLICADMDGKRLWAKNLGVPVNHYGYASSLLAFGNSLIVQYDNSSSPKVMSLDMETGNERWSKNRTDKIAWSSPIIAYIDKKPQLIVMGTPNITSYNPNNGELNWRVECMSGEVGASPCSSSGIVYGASEYANLVAIDATGNVLWKVNEYLPEVSSPVATGDNVFLATSYGVVACYDAKNGEVKKYHEISDEFYSSPVIADGKIYLFGNSGKMYIFSANSDLATIASFDTGERTLATPAFTDGKIVVRTENSLYCAVNSTSFTQ